MPAVSKKQARFMNAVAHNADFAAKVGVPQSVGREFAGKVKDAPAKPAASSRKPSRRHKVQRRGKSFYMRGG